MSYSNVTPIWVILMPDPAKTSNGTMRKYLKEQAEKDGMPEHVRQMWLERTK